MNDSTVPDDFINELKQFEDDSVKVPTHLYQIIELLHSAPNILPTQSIDIRCYYTIDNKAFFGIQFCETPDSFLVGASAQIVLDATGRPMVKSYIQLPVTRVMKSSISTLSKPNPKFSTFYYKYLLDNGPKLLPDYVTEDIIKQLQNAIEEIEIAKKELAEEDGSMPISNVKQELDDKGIVGASDFAFKPLFEGKGNIH